RALGETLASSAFVFAVVGSFSTRSCSPLSERRSGEIRFSPHRLGRGVLDKNTPQKGGHPDTRHTQVHPKSRPKLLRSKTLHTFDGTGGYPSRAPNVQPI